MKLSENIPTEIDVAKATVHIKVDFTVECIHTVCWLRQTGGEHKREKLNTKKGWQADGDGRRREEEKQRVESRLLDEVEDGVLRMEDRVI